MQSWNINPKTGDYVLENGAPQQTDSLLVPAYIRLKAKRTQWLYAPDSNWGSDYYTVKKRPVGPSANVLEKIGERALQPIVDDGRASAITLDTTANTRDNTQLKTTMVDAQGQPETTTFKPLG